MLAKLFPNVYEGWIVILSQAIITTLIGGAFFYGVPALGLPEEHGVAYSPLASVKVMEQSCLVGLSDGTDGT